MLLDWLDQARTDRGLRTVQPNGEWQFTPYSELAVAVEGLATKLKKLNLKGRVVSIAMGEEIDFATAFLACLLIGAVPSPLPSPLTFRSRERFLGHIGGILRAANPSLVLTDRRNGFLVGESLARCSLGAPLIQPFEEEIPADTRIEVTGLRATDLAILQFTSGSTNSPKGVRVSRDSLTSNLMAIREWVRWTDEDSVATWLPLWHDMGLIGTLLVPVTANADTTIISPALFVLDPLQWLRCFDAFKATVSASPTFGFTYAMRRIQVEEIEALDLSSWRVAIIGSDRVNAQVLSKFAKLAASSGFKPSAYLPAYGLAENTLAASGCSLHSEPTVVELPPDSRLVGEKIAIQRELRLGSVPESGTWLTSCGMPLAGTSITICDENGFEMPEGVVGEIVVRGSSLAQGYALSNGKVEDFTTGEFNTGDVGFFWKEELFLIGRRGDSIKVRGRTIYAEEVEEEIMQATGLTSANCAVGVGVSDGKELVTVLIRSEEEPDLASLRRAVAGVAGSSVELRVRTTSIDVCPRTTSGKVQRKLLFEGIYSGALGVECETRP